MPRTQPKPVPRKAIVVGSGPNGLSAAIELARAGCEVEVWERNAVPGGGVRSAQITLPGFTHDLGSAVHALAPSSPFFRTLRLAEHGVEWRWSPYELAHPLDDGAVMLHRSVDETAKQLGPDADAYRWLFGRLVRNWNDLLEDALQPLMRIPHHPFLLAGLGVRGALPASTVARSLFRNTRARALFAGLCAHSVLKLSMPMSASFGVMLGGAAHSSGWPIPVGGAQQLTNALLEILQSYGGKVFTERPVTHLSQLSGSDLQMLDVTPQQALSICGDVLPADYRQSLARFRYGPGAFKVDYALREPIPWRSPECRQAITVHVAGTLEEVEASESDAWDGLPPSRPFVLLVQPSLFDATRAPTGCHTVWAYCHVPNGWTGSALEAMEDQIERFAPGFRDCILARSTHDTAQMEQWNPNLVGGDLGGGAADLKQLLFRPTWRAYETPVAGLYICSSSTPPGGGVHGMCGYNAARVALRSAPA